MYNFTISQATVFFDLIRDNAQKLPEGKGLTSGPPNPKTTQNRVQEFLKPVGTSPDVDSPHFFGNILILYPKTVSCTVFTNFL
jgi:hypothetical protein